MTWLLWLIILLYSCNLIREYNLHIHTHIHTKINMWGDDRCVNLLDRDIIL